jgi:hypothetical protein
MLNIHEALTQVRELQQRIIEKQKFKGYSGRARALAGTFALGMTVFMTTTMYPKSFEAHFYGWSLIFFFAVVVNFGSLINRFLFDPAVKRDFRRLRPMLDELPALTVGGILTFILLEEQLPDLLQSVWLLMLGVSCLSARNVLPRNYWVVGVFYIVCGTLLAFDPNTSFVNPFRTGLIFLIGEWSAGVILHFDGEEKLSWRAVLTKFKKTEDERYV